MKITVLVKPGSKRQTELVAQIDGTYVLYLQEQPIEGRANSAAIVVIARHFGVAKSAVTLIMGVKSKHKVFEINT